VRNVSDKKRENETRRRLIIHSGSVGSGVRELEAEETRGLSAIIKPRATEWGQRRDPTSLIFTSGFASYFHSNTISSAPRLRTADVKMHFAFSF
jgi:hypothetical protein